MKGKLKYILTYCLAAVLAVGLSACQGQVSEQGCQHTYENACDSMCNVCEEEREITHNFSNADCDTPKTCSICGQTEGVALGHEWTTPDGDYCEAQSTCSVCGATDGVNVEHSVVDDGDCTTEAVCGLCGKVMISANAQHIPQADDGDCTTAVACQECGYIALAATSGHKDADGDGRCDYQQCQVVLEDEFDGEDDGIDLPTDWD